MRSINVLCRLVMIGALFLTTTPAPIFARHRQLPTMNPLTYHRYLNDRYGYSVEYPDFLQPQGESESHDGQRFQSKSSPLKMSVWGNYSNWQSGSEMTLAEQRQWERENISGDDLPEAKVTYQPQGINWFVLSGTSKSNIFYQKTVKGHDAFATVLLIYPASKKRDFNEVVTRVAASLKG